MTTNRTAIPCRHCGEAIVDHCSNESCFWWRCENCRALGSDAFKRMIRPLGKKPEQTADGVRNTMHWETTSYGAS